MKIRKIHSESQENLLKKIRKNAYSRLEISSIFINFFLKKKQDPRNKNTFSNYDCKWPPTVTPTRCSSRVDPTHHITPNLSSYRYFFWYHGVIYAIIYSALAFIALSVTYDGLGRLPQNWTVPSEGGIKKLWERISIKSQTYGKCLGRCWPCKEVESCYLEYHPNLSQQPLPLCSP